MTNLNVANRVLPVILAFTLFHCALLNEEGAPGGQTGKQFITFSTTNVSPGDVLTITVQPEMKGDVVLTLNEEIGMLPSIFDWGYYDGVRPVEFTINIDSSINNSTYYAAISVSPSGTFNDSIEYDLHYLSDQYYTKKAPGQTPVLTSFEVPVVRGNNSQKPVPASFVDNAGVPDLMGKPSFSVAQTTAGSTIMIDIPVDAETTSVSLGFTDQNGNDYFDGTYYKSATGQVAQIISFQVPSNPYHPNQITIYPDIYLDNSNLPTLSYRHYRLRYDKNTGQMVGTVGGSDIANFEYLVYPPMGVPSLVINPQNPAPTLPVLELTTPITLTIDGVSSVIDATNRNITFNLNALPASASLSFSISADTNDGSAFLFNQTTLERSNAQWFNCNLTDCVVDLVQAVNFYSPGQYTLELQLYVFDYDYFGYYFDAGGATYDKADLAIGDFMGDYRLRENKSRQSSNIPKITLTLN